MEIWLDKKECTGCGACANVCPKKAISMVSDELGFKYPVIDNNKCINCGLCKRTCPILDVQTKDEQFHKVFAGWSKDKDTRFTSTSGGIFTELTKPIIDQGGYVVGASYNTMNLVEHKIASDIQGLNELKQSKYLQSDTNYIYKDVENLLKTGKTVAFCGAPCQVAGLRKVLKKDYENLLTIEFICRGVNSPKAYKTWLDEIERQENKKIKRVWFKYKQNGWKSSPKRTRIDFFDNTYKIYEGKNNSYMTGYLGPNLYIRPSCGNCKFKGIDRSSDITLADFWGINQELDDDQGTSLILINSNKGMQAFNNIKDNIFFQERTMDEIIRGNMCFNHSVKINKKSEKFLKEINSENFSLLVNKYGKESNIKKVIIKFKNKSKKIIKYLNKNGK